jgi:signal transduction histidine kinase
VQLPKIFTATNVIIPSILDTSDHIQALYPFFRGLTHEIRNPVQGILTSAEALRCLLEENHSVKTLLDLIQRECVRIDALLSDLVVLSEPLSINAEPQSLEQLLLECSRIFPGALSVDMAEDLPAVRFDRAGLRRVILGVLQNAVESQCQEKVLLSAKRNGLYLWIEVKDHGAGILPEDLPRVKEPFFTTRPRKAGLGLTIADRIVRLHNGDLLIESEPGKGTTVSIALLLER